MEKEKISNSLIKKNNGTKAITNNIEKELLDIFQVEEKNFEEHINNFGMKKIIIPDSVVKKILQKLGKNKLDENDKNIIKDYIKKHFILHKKDTILFAKGKIYIIPFNFKKNEKRFSGLDPDDVEFLINEFIKDGFSIKDLNNKVINNLNLEKFTAEKTKKFIDETYKQDILKEYTKIVKKILKFNLDEKIFKGIAGKLFRDNFDEIIDKIVSKLLNKIIKNKEEIIETYTAKLLNEFNFKQEKKDYFSLNKTIFAKIIKELSKQVNDQFFSLVGTRINSEFLKKNSFIKIISLKVYNKFFEEISKKIISELMKDPYNTFLVQNIDSFLSYYSGKTEIIGKNKYKYPQLKISGINKSEDYINNFEIYNYKFILNKLTEFIKKIKTLEQNIKIVNSKIEKIKSEQKEYKEELKGIKEEQITLEKEILKLKEEKRKLSKRKDFLQKEIEENLKNKKNSWLSKASDFLISNNKNLEENLKTIKKEILTINMKIREKQKNLNNLEDKINTIGKNEKKLESLKNEKEAHIKQIQNLEKIIKNIENDLKIQLKQRIKKIK